MAGGRPTKYKDEYCKIAKKMADLGATDIDVAEALDIHLATLNRWKHDHPKFCESLKVGKAPADDRVKASLYRRACGYYIDTEKVFQFQGQEVIVPTKEYVNPDVTAAIFWLKNRLPEEFRANPDDSGSGQVVIQNIMPVPTADSVDDWEKAAQTNQSELLGKK